MRPARWTFRERVMHQRVVAVDRPVPVAVRTVVRRRIAPNLARQISAVEMIGASRLQLARSVAKEEHVAIPLNVHRPEHGADVRKTGEEHVDVGALRAHEERGDAVREAVGTRLASDACSGEPRGLHEVGARPYVLPARDRIARVVEVVGGRRVHVHRRGGDERIDVGVRRAPLLLQQLRHRRTFGLGELSAERNQLSNPLAAVSVVDGAVLSELVPLEVRRGGDRIHGQPALRLHELGQRSHNSLAVLPEFPVLGVIDIVV